MQIGILASDGCFGSGLTSIIDIVRAAEQVRATVDESIPPLGLDVLAPRRRVRTSSDMVVTATRPLSDVAGSDVVVVPGFGTMTGDDTVEALATRDGCAIVRSLTSLGAASPTVAAACTGSFALAEAGLLEHRRATTSWWAGQVFRRRYPAVLLDLDAMVVADGDVITAGAAFSHIDLGLALVRRASPALAERVARLLVIDERAAQSAYIALDHLRHNDPVVLAFERYVRAHLHQPLDLATVASSIGTSRRTLERRTDAALGMSPLALVQRLRCERATHLLRTTGASIEQVASQVGYANGSTLSTLLRRQRAQQGGEPRRQAS
jgi:transcriptional regulator GlxA family with amidase domain